MMADIRRASVASKTSARENPTQGLVPINCTELFLNRFKSWTCVVKNLIEYFEMIVLHEKKLFEAKNKIARELLLPQNSLFSDLETFQVLYRDLIDVQQRQCQEHMESAEMIESQVLPILRSLLVEVKKKALDVDKEWVEVDKDMSKDRETYVKLVSYLRTSLMRLQWKGDIISPTEKEVPKDPWLADQTIKRHVTQCFDKQLGYRKALDEQQKACASFETVIYQNLRVALTLHADSKFRSLGSNLELIKLLKKDIGNIDIESDWNQFVEANSELLKQTSLPVVGPKDLTYDGFDDPLTRIVHEGILFKKESGMFSSSWKSYTALLTGAGFVHLMLNQGKGVYSNPEISLDLAECSVSSLMLNDKEPEEFTITEKSAGMFGRELKHKGNDMEISSKWWALLSDYVRSIKRAASENANMTTGNSDENLSRITQKPLQPSNLSSSSPMQPPKKSHNGSTGSSIPTPESIENLNINPNSYRNHDIHQGVFKNDQIQNSFAEQSQFANFNNHISINSQNAASSFDNVQLESNNSQYHAEISGISAMPSTNASVPLTTQMELAMKAAVDQSSNPQKVSTNPWDGVELDHDDVWS